jgi:hypothetical protein
MIELIVALQAWGLVVVWQMDEDACKVINVSLGEGAGENEGILIASVRARMADRHSPVIVDIETWEPVGYKGKEHVDKVTTYQEAQISIVATLGRWNRA